MKSTDRAELQGKQGKKAEKTVVTTAEIFRTYFTKQNPTNRKIHEELLFVATQGRILRYFVILARKSNNLLENSRNTNKAQLDSIKRR
jgi:hypothetical protein